MYTFTMTSSIRATAKRVLRGSRNIFVTDTGALFDYERMIRPGDAPVGTKTAGPFPARDILAADEVRTTPEGVSIRTGIRWTDLGSDWVDHEDNPFGVFDPIGTYTETNDRRGVFGSLAACVSTSDAVPVLTGVCFDADGTAWATDRYRLARVFTGLRLEGEPGTRVIVSGRLMAEAAKAKTWGLNVGADYSTVSLNGVVLTARNIEGNYPSVAGLMPNGDRGDVAVTLPVGKMLEGIKSLAVPKNGSVELWSDGTVAYQGAEVRLTDDPVNRVSRIGVNPKYLTELLKPHGAKTNATVKWRSEETQKPAYITVDGEDDLRMLVMPVRLP